MSATEFMQEAIRLAEEGRHTRRGGPFGCVIVRRGASLETLRALAKETGADAVYWSRRYEPEAIARAAGVAHLATDVAGFPDGFATRVGERGITLSGGQKQRTAIARALLRDAPVLLLDDCLSNVDTHTEEAILGELRGEMRRRTTLIVSHRVSTVRDADLILVLEHGEVVERGRHDELIALGGHYAALSRAQQLEEEIAAS